MSNHHFSYPVVVPLQGATISGHSSPPPLPVILPARDAAPAPSSIASPRQ